MRRIFTAYALVLALAAPAYAQQDQAALREAAESYVDSPAQQAVIDRLLSADGIMEQTRMGRPDLPEDVVDSIGDIAAEELAGIREPLEEAMVDAAVQTYTLEEIEKLDEFYRSEVGESVLLKTQDFMRVAMQSVGPELQAAQRAIMERANTAIQQAE